MGDKWKEMRLEDCAELVRDTCLPNESFGKPYIGIEHIEQGALRLNSTGIAEDVTSTKSNFKSGDVLFGKLRPYFRKVVRPKFDGICSTDIWVVRAKDGIDQGFLFYLMASKEFVDIANQGSEGTKMPRAKWDFVAKIKQPFPPLSEQKAIASILGALDDKIELNRKMNETLEAMARAIFKSSFTYPFEGLKHILKGEGELQLVDSPLGKIPKGWRVGKVSDICLTQYGYTASASDEPIGPHFLRITDMNKEPWIEWQKVPYCAIDDKTLPRYRLQIGDVLVSRMADPGKAAIIEENVNAVFASYLVRLKAKDLSSSYYLFYFLRSDQYLEYASGAMSGSVQASMNAKVITGANMLFPPDNIIAEFLRVIHPLRLKITDNLKESRTLASIRDALLPKLLSGEIRVKDAERFVEDRA